MKHLKEAQKLYMKDHKLEELLLLQNIRFRPFLASREEFFKGALLVENDTEFIIKR